MRRRALGDRRARRRFGPSQSFGEESRARFWKIDTEAPARAAEGIEWWTQCVELERPEVPMEQVCGTAVTVKVVEAVGLGSGGMETVAVEKRKLGGAWMRWAAYAVDEDAHGIWLYTPKGSIVVGERDGEGAWSYVGVPEAPGLDVLHLVPVSGWWFPAWAIDEAGRRLTVDICRPPVGSGNLWAFDDLELDLWARHGEAGVADHDEFDDACSAGLIDPDERTICLSSAAELETALRSGTAPFDESAWERLARYTLLGLAPLTTP
jgi:hypothetical protein